MESARVRHRRPDLTASALESLDLQGLLHAAAKPSWRHADVLVEESLELTCHFADSAVGDATTAADRGICVRCITDEGLAYRSADRVGPETIRDLLGGLEHGEAPTPRATSPAASPVDEELDVSGFFALLTRIDKAARDVDPRIRQVTIDAEHRLRRATIATLDRGPVEERRRLVYLTIRIVATERGRVATGFSTPATSGHDDDLDEEAIGREVARRALVGLQARPAPIAHLPVVVGPGRGMVLVHEACCHPLEADEVLRGSIYAARVGEPIASPLLSIVDDPLLPGAAGTYAVDDEGTPAAPTTLVEGGVLRSFLTDTVTALRLDARRTGNGRRQSYRHSALPRMSNTCVLAGDSNPADVVADTKRGIYAEHVGGGEVVESTGDFVFRVTNGYLIENGVLTDPIEETTLRGNGARVLLEVDAVGNDVRPGAAKCAKHGHVLPVGLSGPTVRIRSLLVGGTAA